MSAQTSNWPDGKQFAFSIIDDTDEATLATIKPIYELLSDLRLITTKTVWVYPTPAGDPWEKGETLENEAYKSFIQDLKNMGFEIALHGVRGTSSTRRVIAEGLQTYRQVIGEYPKVHVNHSRNLDNLHWGSERMPAWRKKLRLYRALGSPGIGHVESGDYFWGDLSLEHIRYVRGRTFGDIDTLKCDPYMPYKEERFPYVNAWFSCSNGETAALFKDILREENQERLENEHGLCILYTHFGKPGFLDDEGRVETRVQELLESMSKKNGWFRPVSEVLDYLRKDEHAPSLTPYQSLKLSFRQRFGQAKSK
jgi:hypothetical protein